MATGSAVVVLKLTAAVPFCNESWVLFTVTGLPTIDADCSTWLAWVSWISCVRSVLVLICCSTEENCTNSLVNWLESSGDVGSWFCSWVISRDRKSEKLLLRLPRAALPVWAAALVPAEVDAAVLVEVGAAVLVDDV